MQKISDSTSTANAAGEFTEGSPAAGAAATLLKAAWFNTIQRELIALVLGAGLTLSKDDDGQVLKAVKALVGADVDFSRVKNLPTTLGGYKITDAYTRSQTDNLLSTKANNIDVTGALAQKADKATTLGGYGISDAYTKSQTDLAIVNRRDGGLYGGNSNVRIGTNGINAQVNISASTVFLNASSGRGIYVSVSTTIAFSNSGLNGLDTGSPAANAWYFVWVISDGTTTAAILSLSASSPTMPAGYLMSARIGAIRTGPTAGVPMSTIQVGNTVRYKVTGGTNTTSLPLMASGVQGNPAGNAPTVVAVPISSFAPSTAVKIGLSLAGYCANSSAIAAPNNSYVGVPGGSSQSSPLSISQGAAQPTQLSATGDFVIESSNVYYASSASPAGLSCTGWEDSI